MGFYQEGVCRTLERRSLAIGLALKSLENVVELDLAPFSESMPVVRANMFSAYDSRCQR